jgi:hypothetical protein
MKQITLAFHTCRHNSFKFTSEILQSILYSHKFTALLPFFEIVTAFSEGFKGLRKTIFLSKSLKRDYAVTLKR